MKLSPLTLTLCATVVLLSQQVGAKVATTDSLQDNVEWTKDQVQAYLDKYQITYDKNDESIFDTVQKYRHAALANAGLFVNDKTNTVQRLIDGLKIKLEKNYHLTENDIKGFTDDIGHELRQLELSGSLTQDKVKQALGKLQRKAIKHKYVTAAQYKEIQKDLVSSFASPTWFQRLFGASTSANFSDDAFHTWISSTITQRLQENKNLTKDQIQAIIDTLKSAIASTSSSVQDLSKLASTNWWKQLSKDIEKNAKLKSGQVTEIVDSLKDEVNAYKIFAIDYAGEATDETQHVFGSAKNYLASTGSLLYRALFNPVKEDQASSAVSVASSAAASATNAAGDSAAQAAAQAAAKASSKASGAGDAAYSVAGDAAHAAASAASGAAHVAGAAGGAAASAASGAAHVAGSAASIAAAQAATHAAYAAGEAVHVAEGAASHAANGAAQAASGAASAASGAVTDAARAATDAAYAASQSASSATHKASSDFGHFWRQKELDTYKKIGYTQAHIDWVENYLGKTFHDKTHIAKDTVQQALRTIRNYLIQTKIQTTSHIDAQLKSIENLIESWRRSVVHTEL